MLDKMIVEIRRKTPWVPEQRKSERIFLPKTFKQLNVNMIRVLWFQLFANKSRHFYIVLSVTSMFDWQTFSANAVTKWKCSNPACFYFYLYRQVLHCLLTWILNEYDVFALNFTKYLQWQPSKYNNGIVNPTPASFGLSKIMISQTFTIVCNIFAIMIFDKNEINHVQRT